MSRVLPILFNSEMVRAILDGRKTETRRLVMPRNRNEAKEQGYYQGNGLWVDPGTDNGDEEGHIKDYSISPCWMRYKVYIGRYAPYKPGDILYVRETWTKLYYVDPNGYTHFDQPMYFYVADGVPDITLFDSNGFEENDQRIRWRPSIHMPKKAARIWLKVTDVKVERLKDISTLDCEHEGIDIGKCSIFRRFAELWDSTIKEKDIYKYGWRANPWVWVIRFERCEKPESEE